MPIYDYKCKECEGIFEIVKVSESQTIKCSCGSEDVERLFPVSTSFRLVSHPESDVAPWFTNRYSATKKKRKVWRRKGKSAPDRAGGEKDGTAWYKVQSKNRKKRGKQR